MSTEELIPANDFCIHHQVDISFLYSLRDAGLIDISVTEEKIFIPAEQVNQLEKMVHLHEMDINTEGIETINYLLEKMELLQQQIRQLNSRLKIYEG